MYMAYSTRGREIERDLSKEGWRCEWWWVCDEYIPREWVRGEVKSPAIDGQFWISPEGEKIGVLSDAQIRAVEKSLSKKKKRTK